MKEVFQSVSISVATSFLTLLLSVWYTNSRVNSPDSVSIHPVALKFNPFTFDVGVEAAKALKASRSQAGKPDSSKNTTEEYICRVNYAKLDSLFNSTNKLSRDGAIEEYLQAVSVGRAPFQAKNLYPSRLAENDPSYSFESLEKNGVFYDCKPRLFLTDLVSLEAAIVLAENHKYLMSRDCSLDLPDQLGGTLWNGPFGLLNNYKSLAIRITDESEKEGDTETYLLDNQTSRVFLNFSDSLTPDDYQRIVLMIAKARDDGKPLASRIRCLVYFQDKVKTVGGDPAEARVAPKKWRLTNN
jgi:hypothetical protein